VIWKALNTYCSTSENSSGCQGKDMPFYARGAVSTTNIKYFAIKSYGYTGGERILSPPFFTFAGLHMCFPHAIILSLKIRRKPCLFAPTAEPV
jgi:hypothetical protein